MRVLHTRSCDGVMGICDFAAGHEYACRHRACALPNGRRKRPWSRSNLSPPPVSAASPVPRPPPPTTSLSGRRQQTMIARTARRLARASVDRPWHWRILVPAFEAGRRGHRHGNWDEGRSGRLDSSGACVSFILSILARRTRTTRVFSSAICNLPGDYAPQRQPFFAGERAGLHVGPDPGRAVTVNMACHRLCLALDNCMVGSCKAERIQIGKRSK